MDMMDVDLEFHRTVTPPNEPTELCRDRYGLFNVTLFNLLACSQCYSYLFPELRNTLNTSTRQASDLTGFNGTKIPPETVLYPDLFQGAAIKDKGVCDSLGEVKCYRLKSCCSAAIE